MDIWDITCLRTAQTNIVTDSFEIMNPKTDPYLMAIYGYVPLIRRFVMLAIGYSYKLAC